MPGSSIPGAIAGSFRSDRPDIRYVDVDPNRQRRLQSIWSEYDVGASPAGKSDYLDAFAANTPEARRIASGNLNFLNQYATGAYDPTKSYSDILKMNQGALGSFLLNPALNELTRQRKATRARAGYGGQGDGTYDQLLQDRTLQALASQAVPNLLGYTTQAYGTAGNLEQQNLLNRLGIIGSGEQYRQLDTPAMRYLEPTRLARSDVAANLGLFGDVAKQEDLNRAYYRQPGLAERIARGFNEVQSGIYSEVSDVLELYERAYGSGMLGGMGVTGGGKPGTKDAGPWGSAGGASRANAGDFSIPGYEYDDRPYVGGGGGGGGGGYGDMLAYFSRMYGGRGGAGSSPYTIQNPWTSPTPTAN